METNVIEKYDLMDGEAIIDQNFIIVTANEIFYRFVGTATNYIITDIIHQVDLDDFIDVADSLKVNTAKSMVLRMKRVDNSYRWMLMKVEKICEFSNNGNSNEYLRLHISDILSMEKQNKSYRDTLITYSHLLALEGEVVFYYNRKTNTINLYNFVDNSLISILEQNLDDFESGFISGECIQKQTIAEFREFCHDIRTNKRDFCHQITASFLNMDGRMEHLELKGAVTRQMDIVAGSIRNIDTTPVSYTQNTHDLLNAHELLTWPDLKKYVTRNILLNAEYSYTILLIQMEEYLDYRENARKEDQIRLIESVRQTIREMLSYRGVVAQYEQDTIAIAIKGIETDIKTRAFVEMLRSKVLWNLKKLDSSLTFHFSIGIARYPINGKERDVIFDKAVKALGIAKMKGGNRFIIYREHLHDDMLLTNK